VSIPTHRGMILDRRNEPLAISTPVDSIWVNPTELDVSDKSFEKVCQLLEIDFANTKARIEKNKTKEFLYLKRHLEPALAQQVMDYHVPGLAVMREYRRYYPSGEVTAHILGFTDIDDHGQEGLELAYDEWLRGKEGKKRVLKDRMGREVESLEVLGRREQGRDLILSIDRRIQYLTYRELKSQVTKHRATGGSAVVLDVKTGEVIAMVNQPSFNPNNRDKAHDSRYRNRAVTDLFEPGSTIKAFSVINALQQGLDPETRFDTAPGVIVVGGHQVRDIHNYGVLDVAGVLKKSSNIGVTKMTLGLPPESLPNLLSALGFGAPTGVGFPGESVGHLTFPRARQEHALAALSFGYGVSVTPLQLAQAYGALASGGIKRQSTFLKRDDKPAEERVIKEEVANRVLNMLTHVVEVGGTATRARLVNYQVAGKSGTSKKLGASGYLQGHYNSVFAGVAPMRDPRLVMVVMIDDPSAGEYYGGAVAAPVFGQVMEGALRLMGVPPDPPALIAAPTATEEGEP